MQSVRRLTHRLLRVGLVAGALLAAPLLPAALSAQTIRAATGGDAAQLGATIDSLAKAVLDSGEAVGLAILVMRGADTIRAAGYGLADVATARPVTPQTVFRIGSITKQFTAAAILRLVEQGRIRLDDPITQYLPGYPMQGRIVTVQQLLNHTSGIRSYTGMPVWALRMAQEFEPDSLIAMFAAEPFDFEPGTAWKYNNSGYFLLGRIIERLTGTVYAEHIEREIIPLAGLRSTRYCPDAPATGDATGDATGYARAGTPPVPARPLSMSTPHAAGALCSTVLDLARWQHALTTGQVVSPASYAAMTTPDTLADGTRLTYGFGLGVGGDSTHRVVAHSGGINGFVSMLTHLPDDSVTIAVLANVESGVAGQLDSQFRRFATGRPLIRTPAAIALSAAERAVYAGTYSLPLPNGSVLPIRIFEQDGRLMAQATGQGAFPLLAHGNHRFDTPSGVGIRLTFTVADGMARELSLEQGGQTIVGARVP